MITHEDGSQSCEEQEVLCFACSKIFPESKKKVCEQCRMIFCGGCAEDWRETGWIICESCGELEPLVERYVDGLTTEIDRYQAIVANRDEQIKVKGEQIALFKETCEAQRDLLNRLTGEQK